MAGRPTTRYVQAVPAGVQVSTRLGTAVFSRALCTGRRRHAAPQASLCHSRTTGFSTVQHEKLWPTGILVRRPGTHCQKICDNLLQFPFSSAHSRRFYPSRCRVQGIRDIFLFNGLYKFTYLLTGNSYINVIMYSKTYKYPV